MHNETYEEIYGKTRREDAGTRGKRYERMYQRRRVKERKIFLENGWSNDGCRQNVESKYTGHTGERPFSCPHSPIFMHQETPRGTSECTELGFGLGLATEKSRGKGRKRVRNEERPFSRVSPHIPSWVIHRSRAFSSLFPALFSF